MNSITAFNNNHHRLFLSTKRFCSSNGTFAVPEAEKLLKQLNSRNITTQTNTILNRDFYKEYTNSENGYIPVTKVEININKGRSPFAEVNDYENFFDARDRKSKHFEVIKNTNFTFKDIGGYENVKQELLQSVDLMVNYQKYEKYNVRTPKGLILEGPPGNGKTLLAKGFAGETNVGFIAVSGSEFQEKYVGVGSSRVRELFELARKNKPCIVFIDEVDAIGRARSSESESSGAERDSTLNQLLVCLDGFKENSGVFTICATNRVDLLDKALLRPGRIDKSIFIGLPDEITRKAILNIHIEGKPRDNTISVDKMVDISAGLSCAQIENVLNEAMLNALRENREIMSQSDIENSINKILVGWQPSEHMFTPELTDRIVIHELGHAFVGLACKHHPKMKKVVINLSSPKTPGYTIFESIDSNIYTREALFERLMVLLAGRIAEEVIYDTSVTTGAINDFNEAYNTAEKMILYYGMGDALVYPRTSEKYKELIDIEITQLINRAYFDSLFIIQHFKNVILECKDILKKEKSLDASELIDIVNKLY